jgi:hypothetical protein
MYFGYVVTKKACFGTKRCHFGQSQVQKIKVRRSVVWLLFIIFLNECNSPAQHVVYCPLWALPPSRFCSWWRELTSEPDAPKHVQHVSTSTTSKASNTSLTRRCGILQSTLLKEPDDPVGTTGQLVRSALIPNVTARPNMLYIVRFGPYRPHGFVPGDVSSLLSLTPQNAYNMLASALLIRPATHPSPADVGSYNEPENGSSDATFSAFSPPHTHTHTPSPYKKINMLPS